MMKLLIALRFYAVGCFIEPLADMFGMSKSSACDIVTEVSFLIASKRNDFVRMSDEEIDVLRNKALFQRIGGFPLAIAAVDGTHIRIQSFGGDDAELYRNRKTYFSMNCQIAASADVITVKVYR